MVSVQPKDNMVENLAPFHQGWLDIDTPEDLKRPETAKRVRAIAQSTGLQPQGI